MTFTVYFLVPPEVRKSKWPKRVLAGNDFPNLRAAQNYCKNHKHEVTQLGCIIQDNTTKAEIAYSPHETLRT